ncbi:MAG: DUF4249 family protein [Bacteroidales bacterium]|nr:DUF4249 family protein [Bacteroidales bacterium]
MKRLLLLIIMFAAVSCVYDYDIPVIGESSKALVFDGSIIVGSKARLDISRITPTGGKLPEEEDMIVLYTWWVEDEDGTVYNVDNSGTIDLSTAPTDKAYKIVAKCDGKTYSSPLQKPIGAPQLDTLTFSSDGYAVYCNVSFQQDTAISKYVALSFEEIWQFHTDFQKAFDVLTEYNEDSTEVSYKVIELEHPDLSRYYCWTQTMSSADVLVDLGSLGGKAIEYPINTFLTTNSRNHREYHIKVLARSLSDREYRFGNTLVSQEGGFNLFTPNPGEIAGNVSCEEVPSEHVYGYISTSSSSSIEAVLDQRYLKAMTPNPYSLVVPSPSVDLSVYLNDGMWPVAWMMLGDSKPVGWGKLRCIDCIEAGGTLEKPEFLN